MIDFEHLKDYQKIARIIYERKHVTSSTNRFEVFPIDRKKTERYNLCYLISEPKEKKSSFMELPKYINLDYLLSVKYTRVVDVSNCVSLNGFIFVIDTKEILHKKKIELCISKRIGVKARFNDKWYKVMPISNSNKKSLKSNDSVKAIIEQFVYFNCLKNERLSA